MELPKRKERQLEEKLGAVSKPVGFQIPCDSNCSRREAEIEENDLLLPDAEHPLCLVCEGLGNATLTRRATKCRAKSAVVVRLS